MFQLDITREMIEEMPKEDRGPWLDMLEREEMGKQLIKQYIANGEYDKALGLAGSEKRAQYLIEIGSRVPDHELSGILGEWWSVTEAWSGDLKLREGMYDLLKRVAPLYVTDDVTPLPDKTLTIYRGNLGERPYGLSSWTLDYEVAERFARMAKSFRGIFLGMYREDGISSIWKSQCWRKEILGYFDDRDEKEIVVDIPLSRHIELVAQSQ